MSARKLSSKILGGAFLVALLLLAIVFLLSNWTMGQLARAGALRDHRHQGIEKLQLLLTELDDAETGQRGYLITGEPSYLQPYQEARDTVRLTVRALSTELNDPQMRQDLASLKPLVKAKLGELDRTIELRRTAGFAPAQKVVLTNRGKQIMDEIRRIVGRMSSREETLLTEADKATRTMSQNSVSVRLLGNALSILLLLGVFILLSREIRSRNKIEKELRVSEGRYRLVSGQVKDYAIIMLDAKGFVQTWNDGAEQIEGYTSGEIVGQHFSILSPSSELVAGQAEQELAMAQEKGRCEVQGWRVRKDGSQFWARVVMTALRDERGALVGYSKIVRDETAQRQAEETLRRLNRALESRTAELEASNKELEAFTYSVSHDLRAPLRHVDGFSKMLLEGNAEELSEDAKRYLGYVREGVLQMGQLVDDLLALARVGRKELNVQVTGLDSLVKEVVAELGRDNPGREIVWKIEPLPFVECDPALMKQVFANLLSNAVKYTRPRAKALIEIGPLQENGCRGAYIRDNGVGFNMKYANKLFGVFQRLHRAEDFEGTGVGLATVQRIIHKHGGRVWAEAVLDEGATFYFVLGAAGKRETGTRRDSDSYSEEAEIGNMKQEG